MANYIVTKVRKELSSDGLHRHIEGVISNIGIHYTRQEVVKSIQGGDVWRTSAGGSSATITTATFCPKAGCFASPYIKTNPNSTEQDNLENLPEG